MAGNVTCYYCKKSILEGIPFCPHCGKKQSVSKGTEFNSKDPYMVLEVTQNAEAEVIEAAFKQLSKKYHPDINKNPDAELRMQEINWAFDILSNPEKRFKYDNRYQNYQHQQDKKPHDFHWEERSKEPVTSQTPTDKTPSSTVSKPKTSGIKKTGITKQLGYIFLALTGIFIIFYLVTLSISKNINTPIVISTLTNTKTNLITKTQSPSTQSTTPISKILRYSTSWDSVDEALNSGIQDLFVYIDKTEQSGTTIYYYIDDLRTNSVLWGGGWCSKTTDKLNDNWNKLLFSYKIDNKEIPRIYFRSYDFDSEIDIPSNGKQPAKCRSELIVLYDWPIGFYKLNVDYTIVNDFNNGWDTYLAKTNFHFIYIVQKKSLSPSTTQEIRIKATSTPSCIPWQTVTKNDYGKFMCVYGRIAKIQWSTDYNPSVYVQIIRFSVVPGDFLLRSRDKGFNVSVGDCVAFSGIVNWDGYLFMDIGETTFNYYSNCD